MGLSLPGAPQPFLLAGLSSLSIVVTTCVPHCPFFWVNSPGPLDLEEARSRVKASGLGSPGFESQGCCSPTCDMRKVTFPKPPWQ